MPRSRRALWLGIIILIALIILWKLIVLYTDYLWFASPAIGKASVFTRIYATRAALLAVVAVFVFGFLFLNLRLARRAKLPDVEFLGPRLLPPAERAQIEEHADSVLLWFSLIVAGVMGVVASHQWLELLQFSHWTPFDPAHGPHEDPIFHKNIGFYVLQLPFIEYVWQAGLRLLLVTLIASAVVYVYEEAVRMVANRVQLAPAARRHLFILAAAALIWKGLGYRLSMFETLWAARGAVYGAGFTEVHVHIPIYWFLMVVTIAAAGVVLYCIRTGNVRLAAFAVIGLFVFSFLGNSVAPRAVQRIVVQPTELEKETPYLRYNIDYTRAAYKIDIAEEKGNFVEYNPANPLTARDIADNQTTLLNLRLWDDRALEVTAEQLQELRPYYDFPDVDIDRYVVDGRYRQVMLSPRQLNPSRIPPPAGTQSPTWVNRHLEYTHGYGIVLCPVNELVGTGLPNWFTKDIPPVSSQGAPEVKRPELYFQAWVRKHADRPPRAAQQPPEQPGGPTAPGAGPAPQTPRGPAPPVIARETRPNRLPLSPPHFVIVGGQGIDELDYPSDPENVRTRYQGRGGIQLGGFFRRLAFFLRFMDWQILFTGYIGSESRILIHTMVTDAAQTAAPFLLFDPDPYVVVTEEGRLKWLLDCYTYSRRFPYSERDSQLPLNYVRNSVKACVDAYDGTLDLYIADPTDPIVQTYRSIFPDLFTGQNLDAIPQDLRSHIRYPRGLFDIQAEKFLLYHLTREQDFYSQEDRWSFPNELYQFPGGAAEGVGSQGDGNKQRIESYYVVMRLPHADQEEFLVMAPFAPHGKEDRNMLAWMCGRCDGEQYGTLRVYRFPKRMTIYGPMQIEARISQDPTISELETLWGRGGSSVIRGNLLVIPVADSLLYMEPLYIQSQARPLPELKRVIIAVGDRITMQPSIQEALDDLFGAKPPGPPAPAPGEPSEIPTVLEGPPPAPATPDEVAQLAKAAKEHFDKAQEAFAKGDYVQYGREQEALRKALEDLVRETR